MGYKWYVSCDGEYFNLGEYNTLAEVLEEFKNWDEGDLYICEAKKGDIKLSDWLDIDYILRVTEENAFINLSNREYGNDPIFDMSDEDTQSLEAVIIKAVDKWQTDRGLKFRGNIFTDVKTKIKIKSHNGKAVYL